MEFDKTRWSYSWNSDQNCKQGLVGSQVVGGHWGTEGGGGPGSDGGLGGGGSL